MAWVSLMVAGFLEIGWAVGLKYTKGFSRLWPSVATVIAMALSFGLLSFSLKSLPIGTAYAVWTGIGAEWWHDVAGGAERVCQNFVHYAHCCWNCRTQDRFFRLSDQSGGKLFF